MSVSIIIATYGDEAWKRLALTRAYPSATKQDAAEIIAVHEPDMSIAQVRNAAAERATSEWLCFLDADDELGPNYTEVMWRALEQEREIDETTPPLLTPAVRQIRRGRSSSPSFFDRGVSLRDDNWLVLGTLVQRELFLEVGGFNDYPHGFEDWSLWAKCWKAGAKIVKVRDAVYIYYWNPDSAHHKSWKDRKWQIEMHNKVRAELFPELA